MFYLMYLSTAVSMFSEGDLFSILEISHLNNKEKSLTGVLLYHEGVILQVLEGNKSEVIQMFKRISNDSRHKDIVEILSTETNSRYFSQWAMGFRKMSSAEWQQIEGYLPIKKNLFDSNESSFEHLELVTFLKSFYYTNFNY